MGGFATSPLRGGGGFPNAPEQETKSEVAINGQIGYMRFTIWGVPNALERRKKSEVAHKWADWLHHICSLGGPQHFTTQVKIRTGT